MLHEQIDHEGLPLGVDRAMGDDLTRGNLSNADLAQMHGEYPSDQEYDDAWQPTPNDETLHYGRP